MDKRLMSTLLLLLAGAFGVYAFIGLSVNSMALGEFLSVMALASVLGMIGVFSLFNDYANRFSLRECVTGFGEDLQDDLSRRYK